MRIALALVFVVVAVVPAHAAATTVTWPQAREYAVGERISVTVRSDRNVRVAVLRVSSTGKVMRAVARRTVKRGTVTVTLSRAGTYAVRVERRQRVLKVTAPAGCPEATPTALEATLSADRVQRGQTLRFTVTNVSEGCVSTGSGYEIEYHRGDGVWMPVGWRLTFPPAPIGLQRGEAIAHSVAVPANAPLGPHRLVGFGGFTEPAFEVIA